MITDAERARLEMAELYRQVDAAFEDPASLPPPIPDAVRRPRLRIWVRPSFANHRCWTIWGGSAGRGLLRRVEWRRDLDGNRQDPLQRLARLGQPIRATFHVRDGHAELDELISRIGTPPVIEPAEAMTHGLSIHVDGTLHGVELKDGSSTYRYESLHPWLPELCEWLDACLEDC